MSKPHIAAGLSVLAKSASDANGVKLAAHIACHLSHSTPLAVNLLEFDLGYPLRSLGLRSSAYGQTPAGRINLRRASNLIYRTVGRALGEPPGGFDELDHTRYIQAAKTRLGQDGPNRDGFYLAPSFWAFSSHDDRVMVRTAWDEARRLAVAGLKALCHRDSESRSSACYRRWFGDATPSRTAAVGQVLQRVYSGLQQACVSVSCMHRVTDDLTIVEKGVSAGGGTVSAKVTNAAVWGTAWHRGGFLCLGSNFFDPLLSSRLRTTIHRTARGSGLEISRGGAILHEATHLFGNTDDLELVKVPDFFADPEFEEGKKNPDAAAYGPWICARVADLAPHLAVDNADSFRLFCEDAFARVG
ncbi:hypothetical protein VARIO8X_110070 [Burkholderiales bacterium 8X]|nr:hypothetical protein VARIO8X_110070 [Burkholderiales bacterium 8X]